MIAGNRSFSDASLLRRLLLAILGPLMLLATILAVGSGYLIHSLSQRTSDRVLLGSLAAIAETVAIEDGQITYDLPPAALGMLEEAERDNVYYSLRHDQLLLSGYRDLPSSPAASLVPGKPEVRDELFRGETVRIASVAKRLPRLRDPVVVQVAETMQARRKLQLRLAAIVGALVGLLVVGAGLLIPPAVARGLRPLDRLRIEVEERSGREARVDFSPLSAERAPVEVQPFIGAFNELLHQVEIATAGMRQFTSDASHQMRTPLAVLRTHIALARNAEPGSTDVARALDEVANAATRLERLLAQLLSLARAEELGKHELPAVSELAQVARSAVANHAPQAIASNVDISFEEESEGPLLTAADPLLLEEMIANLIDNAIRYNHPGGRVVVRTSAKGGYASVEVEDDGPGIARADRAAVFERFARLRRDTTKPGSGLGLSIVRALARRHGGEVAMHDPPGGGAGIVFIVTLPRVVRATTAP